MIEIVFFDIDGTRIDICGPVAADGVYHYCKARGLI